MRFHCSSLGSDIMIPTQGEKNFFLFFGKFFTFRFHTDKNVLSLLQENTFLLDLYIFLPFSF